MYGNEPNRRRSSCAASPKNPEAGLCFVSDGFCLRSPQGSPAARRSPKWWVADAMAEPSALRLLRLVRLPQL